MNSYILYLQDSNGRCKTYGPVEASSSVEAVNNNLEGTWVLMTRSEIPSGIYRSGTYSVDNGYVTVKKPNNIHDWLRRV